MEVIVVKNKKKNLWKKLVLLRGIKSTKDLNQIKDVFQFELEIVNKKIFQLNILKSWI